jgi:hypothetical protein
VGGKGSAADEAIGPALDSVLAHVDALLLDLDPRWADEPPPRRINFRHVRHALRARRAAAKMLVLLVVSGFVIGWLVSRLGS